MATKAVARVTRKGCPNHPIDFKRRLAALACEPGVSVAKLALTHGINTNLLFKWRRHYRAGQFGAPAAVAVAAPVTPAQLLPVVASAAAMDMPRGSGRGQPCIEIVLAAATVRVCGEVSAVALTTVLDCLVHRR